MKACSIVIALTLGAAALGLATISQAAVTTTYAVRNSDVLFHGVTYLTGAKRATVAGRAWQVMSRGAAGGNVKDYVNPYYPPAELEFGANGVQALAGVINEFSAGRPPRLSTQVHTVTGDPDVPDWTSLGDAEVAYFEFPKFDAGGKSAATFEMRVVPTNFAPMSDKIAGTTAPLAPPAVAVYSSSFAVSIPGIDCSHVTVVDNITIESAANTRSTGGRESNGPAKPASGVSNWNFTLEANGASARGLREWMLANQGGSPTKREISIQVMANAGGTALFTLHGIGVGLMSVQSAGEAPDAVRGVRAELFVERWEVLLPGAPKPKLELAVPGLGTPTGRK